MSFDRIDPFSANFNWPNKNQPNTQPPAFSGSSNPTRAGDSFVGNYAMPVVGSASHSFARDWAQSSTIFGSKSLAAEVINRATAPTTPIGAKLNTTHKAVRQRFGKTTSKQAASAQPQGVTYSHMFHLDNRQVPLQDANLKNIKETVKTNTRGLTDYFKNNSNEKFFKGVTPKSYFKDTVIKSNIQPVKNLFSDNPNKELGTGLLRTAAGGLLGFDVLKHAHEAYKTAHAQEDGSIKSQWNTAAQTVKAVGKYSARDGTSWEMAGIGAAIGKAIIPIALGGVSLGGILFGALAGVATQKLMDTILKTGDKDPEHKEEGASTQKGGSAALSVKASER